LCSLRREATDFYRAVHPLLGVTASVERAAKGRPDRIFPNCYLTHVAR
jgi:hypothetical protein